MFDAISIDMTMVLGSTYLPIRQILKMSRGAMIPLDAGQDDPTLIYVGDELIARGKVLVDGDQISLEITDVIRKPRA